MADVEVLDDCRSEQVAALIREHNQGVKLMAAVRDVLVSHGVTDLPQAPRRIILKQRS